MKSNILRIVSLAFVLCWVETSVARHLAIDAHSPIVIDSYDPVSQTYEVTDTTYPGQGPLIVTPENLAKSVTAVDLDRIRRDPKSIITNQYSLDALMTLLTPQELQERKKKLAQKKPGS